MVTRFTLAYVGVRKEYLSRNYKWQQPESDSPAAVSLKAQSHQKVDLIVVSKKLNQYFLWDRLWFLPFF
jgi:hypothetical protein